MWTALFLTLSASISVRSDARSYKKLVESILIKGDEWGDRKSWGEIKNKLCGYSRSVSWVS